MKSPMPPSHDTPLWTTPKEVQPVGRATPSLEALLYGALALVALALRLAALGRWPLLESEAESALAALRTVRGMPLEALEYSPLIYNVNLVLFSVTRATAASTRLLPALLGSALVAIPYAARERLGRRGALMAAALLALAPSWVFFSRTSVGALPSAAACALMLAAAQSYWRTQSKSTLYAGIVALGLGLTAGAGLYTLLLAGLAYGLGSWLARKRQGTAASWLAVWRERAAPLRERRLALTLLAVTALSATTLSLNLGGLGATMNLAGRWARELAPAYSGLPWYALGKRLLVYEALTVALAIAGAVWGLRRKEALTWFALCWLAVALVLGMALGHRGPEWTLDALLPLVILAARGFEHLWRELATELEWRDGVALWVAFCFLAFGFLELASYTHNGQREFLWYALISWGVLLAALAAQAFWTGPRSMLRVGAALCLLTLALVTVRTTTAVAYQTGRDPREGLVHRPTSVQVRDLEAALRATSYHRIGDPTLLDVAYEERLGSLLEWTLRDYTKAQAVPGLSPVSDATALLGGPRSDEERLSGYVAQRFRLRESWPAQTLSIREKLRWLVFRDLVGAEGADEIQLWIKLPEGRQAN